MIDRGAITRDAAANIADWPVTIRHYYMPALFIQMTAGLNSGDDFDVLMDGGLLDKPDMDIIALADSFLASPHVKNRDRIDVLVDGNWIQFEVKRTPDYYDPLAATVRFRIGTPNE